MSTDPMQQQAARLERCRQYESYVQGLSLGALRRLSEDDLVARYDCIMTQDVPLSCVKPKLWQLGPGDYTDELNRRAADRQTHQLLVLT